MVDNEGFRQNVGIILTNAGNKVLWGRRIGQEGWQFPQGGMCAHESPTDAMYRELKEELGLDAQDVSIIAETSDWLRYRLPKQFIRQHQKPVVVGQAQKWFLLRLDSGEHAVNLAASDTPEFDDWRWVDYWYPVDHVIQFKQDVYRQVLSEFESVLFQRQET